MIHPETHIVKPRDDVAAPQKLCCYCQQPYGGTHKVGCVMRQRTVTVRATIEYVIAVPEDWDADQIEFHRNEGSWCADNLLDELKADGDKGCLCHRTSFQFLHEATEEEEKSWGGAF